MTRILFAALALACVCSPALAQAVVSVPGAAPIVVAPADSTSVTLSAAPWIALLREIITTVAIPLVSGFLIQAIRKVYPWAALFLTQKRVEMMANAVTEFAINAIPGAAKEAKLSVHVGSQVIAKALQRAIDAAPSKVLEAAGGQAGLAAIVFRKLNLAEDANEQNTLRPVLATLPADGK